MKKEKSKILFLLHLPPPVHGSSMVGQWIKDSKEINSQYECSYINLLASKNVGDSGHVSVSKILGFVIVWFDLLGRLFRNRPSICYFALTSTGAAFYKDVLLVFLLRLFRIKRVYHLHNKGIANASNNSINRLLYRYVFNKSKVIILSKRLYKDIAKFVPLENVFVCPNGVPDVIFDPAMVFNKGNKILEILFLSNLIESKGVIILLKALRIVKRKGIPFHCSFVGGEGDINERQFVEHLGYFDLVNEVDYLGKKFGKEKDLLFQQSDIFTFPTFYRNECFPLVVLEAMQHSLPVISTYEGGILDIIEDGATGFLVPQRDEMALAEKLEELLLNPSLAIKMGMAGRKRYETHFTLEDFESNFLSIIDKL